MKCPVCGKDKKHPDRLTCSYSCSNRYVDRTKRTGYRSICFYHHEKKCIICGENKIVSVHHMDEDRTNNSPENLIPLCPTHHQYVHSRYKHLILDKIEKYIKDFLGVA